jgi:hypothetical protein
LQTVRLAADPSNLMKKHHFPLAATIVLVALLPGSPLAAQQPPDPVIETLIARVSLQEMHADIATLVAMGSRRFDRPGGLQAQDFLYTRLQSLGYPVELQDFDANHDNVIATLPGVVAPTEIYVLGAHYDSINGAGPDLPAPGADDNGTGVAGLLEIARILSESGVRFEATIELVGFASEEVNRLGSKAYVDEAILAGEDIRNGVVLDVLGYLEPGSDLDISIGTSDLIPGTDAIEAISTGVVETYLPGYAWEFGLNCS